MRVIQAQQNQVSSIEDAKKERIRVLTEIVGTVELADEIVGAIDTLEEVDSSGASREEVAAAELAVQRLLEQAGGEAGESLLIASAARWKRHMYERGRAMLLEGQQEAYLAAPGLYRSKMYFEAWLEATKDARVYLVPSDLESLKVRVELQDREAGRDVFDADAGEDLNQ